MIASYTLISKLDGKKVAKLSITESGSFLVSFEDVGLADEFDNIKDVLFFLQEVSIRVNK